VSQVWRTRQQIRLTGREKGAITASAGRDMQFAAESNTAERSSLVKGASVSLRGNPIVLAAGMFQQTWFAAAVAKGRHRGDRKAFLQDGMEAKGVVGSRRVKKKEKDQGGMTSPGGWVNRSGTTPGRWSAGTIIAAE